MDRLPVPALRAVPGPGAAWNVRGADCRFTGHPGGAGLSVGPPSLPLASRPSGGHPIGWVLAIWTDGLYRRRGRICCRLRISINKEHPALSLRQGRAFAHSWGSMAGGSPSPAAGAVTEESAPDRHWPIRSPICSFLVIDYGRPGYPGPPVSLSKSPHRTISAKAA